MKIILWPILSIRSKLIKENRATTRDQSKRLRKLKKVAMVNLQHCITKINVTLHLRTLKSSSLLEEVLLVRFILSLTNLMDNTMLWRVLEKMLCSSMTPWKVLRLRNWFYFKLSTLSSFPWITFSLKKWEFISLWHSYRVESYSSIFLNKRDSTKKQQDSTQLKSQWLLDIFTLVRFTIEIWSQRTSS